jgi:hypothetical protein
VSRPPFSLFFFSLSLSLSSLCTFFFSFLIFFSPFFGGHSEPELDNFSIYPAPLLAKLIDDRRRGRHARGAIGRKLQAGPEMMEAPEVLVARDFRWNLDHHRKSIRRSRAEEERVNHGARFIRSFSTRLPIDSRNR